MRGTETKNEALFVYLSLESYVPKDAQEPQTDDS